MSCISCWSAYTAAYSSRGEHSWLRHMPHAIGSTSFKTARATKAQNQSSRMWISSEAITVALLITVRCSEAANKRTSTWVSPYLLRQRVRSVTVGSVRRSEGEKLAAACKGQLPLQISVLSRDWMGSQHWVGQSRGSKQRPQNHRSYITCAVWHIN